MKVIYTDQSLASLEKGIRFLRKKQKLPTEKIDEIITQLFDRADSLSDHPYLGQYEEYLTHLNKGHRRLVEGHFKIIYRVFDNHIDILDFFYTRQKISKMKS
jgi:plasmid stabilization system protein ParE